MENVKNLNKIEIIKNLYEKINDKQTFWAAIATDFNMKTSSVRVGWFYRFDIPEKYKVQSNVIEFMENYIENQ